jgi:DNA-binding PadR family transcriptional regulator
MTCEPSAGRSARTTTEASPIQRTGGGCYRCDAPADGLDARVREPVCQDCAGKPVFLPDGGYVERPPESLVYTLTGFQRDLLAVLVARTDAGDETPGQRIKEDLEARGYAEINHGRLYPNLDGLADRDLVEKEPFAYDRRTNAYRPSQRGRELIEHYATTLASDVGLETEGPGDE